MHSTTLTTDEMAERIRNMPWVREFRVWWVKEEPPKSGPFELPKPLQEDGLVHTCFWYARAVSPQDKKVAEYAESMELPDKRLEQMMRYVAGITGDDLWLLMWKRGLECMSQLNPTNPTNPEPRAPQSPKERRHLRSV